MSCCYEHVEKLNNELRLKAASLNHMRSMNLLIVMIYVICFICAGSSTENFPALSPPKQKPSKKRTPKHSTNLADLKSEVFISLVTLYTVVCLHKLCASIILEV